MIKRIEEERARIDAYKHTVGGAQFFNDRQYREDFEWLILSYLTTALSAAGWECPEYAQKLQPPEPDFQTYLTRDLPHWVVETTEVLRPDYRRGDYFMGRPATFNLIGTIENRIYKIYFKFLDDHRAAFISFRDEIREYLSENMTPHQFSNPQIQKVKSDRLSTWHFDWGNILLEEFEMLTEVGPVWNTAIAATSDIVRSAKRIGFFDALFKRV